MNDMNNLNNFNLPEDFEPPKETPTPGNKTLMEKLEEKVRKVHGKIIRFSQKRLGEDSRITHFLENIGKGSGDSVIDAFSELKKVKSAEERLNASLTVALIIVLLMVWQWGFPMLAEADQLRNDLKEQDQVIKIEQKNNESLEKWIEDREKLEQDIRTVYSAIPDADEKAEEIISMLENMAWQNRMIIDAIGIRKLPESQIYYDELIGTVDLYEYTFTLESTLPNILSFIGSLRQSLRLMDIMAMEIEESKGLYRASFLIHAYHLAPLDNAI